MQFCDRKSAAAVPHVGVFRGVVFKLLDPWRKDNMTFLIMNGWKA